MADTQTHIDDIARTAWLLYSDLNTRLSILREESAHLQNTVYGLASSEYVDSIFAAPADNTQARRWLHPAAQIHRERLNNNYSTLSAKEKTFAHLVEMLGAILVGLDKNKQVFLESYIKFVERYHSHSLEKNQWAASRAFFHFVASRGALLNSAIQKYTSDLEMAHEKLVQILENFAGNLPQPILFRRWNSALIEGFLSDYARHISWQIRQQLENNLSGDSVYTQVHTWTHSHTSHFEGRQLSDSNKGKANQNISLTRSAYFYLEQPILLPLLYHEMAHASFEAISRQPTSMNAQGKALADAKEEFLVGLSSTLRMESDFVRLGGADEKVWGVIAEEIWSDAVSIANAGRSYLVALTLQIFGQNGATFYPICDLDTWQMHPYDRLVLPEHFYENPGELRIEASYFWEARLKIAAWVMQQLSDDAEDDLSTELATSISSTIVYWQDAGNAVLSDRAILGPLERNWQIRVEVNDWFFDAGKRYLGGVISVLKKFSASGSNWLDIAAKPESIGFNCSPSFAERLSGTVGEYFNCYFPAKAPAQGSLFEAHTFATSIKTLEEPALQTRLSVAKAVINNFRMRPTFNIDEIRNWISTFSDYCRHDGSTAFRLALETLSARDSLLFNIGELLQRCQDSGEHFSNCSTLLEMFKERVEDAEFLLQELETPLAKVLESYTANNPSLKQPLLAMFSSRFFFNRKAPQNCDPAAHKTVLNILNTLTSSVIQSVLQALYPELERKQIPPQVGTFQLGYVRPYAEAYVSPYAIPELKAEQKGHLFCMTQVNKLLKEAGLAGVNENGLYRSVTIPAIGDYSFVNYTQGLTPSEQNWHSPTTLKYIVKPRVVLTLANQEDDAPAESFRNLLSDTKRVRVVCLIKQRYRWQWVTLLKRLQKYKQQEPNFDFRLSLSTAWEDAVLVMSAVSLRDLVKAHSKAGLDAAVRLEERTDTQSLVLPRQIDGDVPLLNWSWNRDDNPNENLFPNFVRTHTDNLKVFAAFGRHDYVLAPTENGEILSDPALFLRWLHSLPKPFWKEVGNYSTIVEWQLEKNSSQDAAKPMFMLRVNMKSDG